MKAVIIAEDRARATFAPGVIMTLSLLLLVYLLAFGDALALLVRTWIIRDDTSHGFLIPLISLWIAYSERQRVKNIAPQPATKYGVAALVLSFGMMLLGKVSATTIIELSAVPVSIFGLVVLLFGMIYVRAFFLPLSYLFLMLPLIDFGADKLHRPFQLLTAEMTEKAIRLIGIPVFREASILHMQNINLEVAVPCSGISYLISIIALAIPLAHFTQKTLARKSLIVCCAIVIGIVANWARVTLIALWTHYSGHFSHGPFHIFQGIFVSVVGFLFLFVFALYIRRYPARLSQSRFVSQASQAISDTGATPAQTNKKQVLVGILLFTVFFVLSLFVKVTPVSLAVPIGQLPRVIRSWDATELTSEMSPFHLIGPDSEIVRIYKHPVEGDVMVYVAYFEQQSTARKLVSYQLDPLYENATAYELPLDGNRKIAVNRTILRNGGGVYYGFFWLLVDGNQYTNRYITKASLALNGILRRNTSGALVCILTRAGGEDERGEWGRTSSFSREIIPVLQKQLVSSGAKP